MPDLRYLPSFGASPPHPASSKLYCLVTEAACLREQLVLASEVGEIWTRELLIESKLAALVFLGRQVFLA